MRVSDAESFALWREELNQVGNAMKEIMIANNLVEKEGVQSFQALFNITKLYNKMAIGATKAKTPEERSFYEVLIASIQNGTGIKVKTINNIIFYNYDSVFEIDFTEDEYNLELRLSIPNIKNAKFFPTISDTLKEEDVQEILFELDLKLSRIKERTNYSTSLEVIVSYPNARDKNGFIESTEKFKEYLDTYATKNIQNSSKESA
jgi:hypothetical protein